MLPEFVGVYVRHAPVIAPVTENVASRLPRRKARAKTPRTTKPVTKNSNKTALTRYEIRRAADSAWTGVDQRAKTCYSATW